MTTDWKSTFRRMGQGDNSATFGGEIDFGVDGDTIKKVQTALNAAGQNPPLTVDGALGPMTTAAIKSYQQSKGLSPDGVIGPQTLGVLGIAIPVSSGSSVGPSTLLSDKSTPMTPDDVAKAIASGYKQVTGQSPTPQVLALMLAQSSFETGGWGKGIHNYNFGNAKATGSDKYYQVFHASEVVNGQTQFSDMKFAAFTNPADAGAHYVRLLKNRPNWWNGLQTGTPEGFIQGLKTQPEYFTGPADTYLKAVKANTSKYMALANQYSGYVASAISIFAGTWVIVGGVVAVGVTLYEMIKRQS